MALAGVGLGGAFWSLMVQKLIDLLGWRNAYLGIAAIIVGIVLPVLLLLVRERPAIMGSGGRRRFS